MVERYIKSKGAPAVKWAFLAVFIIIFIIDYWLVVTGRTQAADDYVLAFFVGIRGDALTMVFRAITFCGNPITMVGLCVFVVAVPRRLKVGIPVVLMTVCGWGAQTLLKEVVGRPRPDMSFWLVEESSYSFPSGHANVSMIFWTALLILVGRALILKNRRGAAVLLRVLLAVFAALIGVSRLYLGIHYLSDVAGGWLLAGAILVLLFAAYDNLWPRKWRVSYDNPKWDAIPRGAEKKRRWKKAPKKRPPSSLINFPKKSNPWKMSGR